jgi:biopolymer transport protein ExbD
MRIRRSRVDDSTFELNLAPFLDIIVSIIPMLLLSVAFIQIKMIETSVPQIVEEKLAEQKKNDKTPVTLMLEASRANGFTLVLNEQGAIKKTHLGLKEGKLDFAALGVAAADIKKRYVDIFKMDFKPGQDISYDEIVMTMDSLRRFPNGEKVAVSGKSGETISTDLMFPDVTFANILGE